MASLENLQNISSQNFFNLPSPSAPIVSIQFRTKVKENAAINDPDQWESITFDPSSLFNSLTVTDESGFQRVELTLLDKDFAHLENVITKAMLAPRLSNKLAQDTTITSKDTKYFQFKVDNSAMINMRIRFGYSNIIDNSIDETSFGTDFYNRINSNKTVLKTPWIYLQILNIEFNVIDAGLQAVIQAFATADTFLERAKILRRFMIFKGTTINILTEIQGLLSDVSNKSIEVEIQDQPLPMKTKDGKNYIEIPMGNANDESSRSWMNLRTFLDTYCSKVPKKVYDIDNKETKEDDEDEKAQKLSKVVPYTYMLKQEIQSDKKMKYTLIFYYPDPLSSSRKQTTIRNYIWKNYGQSIVKSLNIKSKVDFAALNRQIFVYDKTNNSMKLKVARPEKADTDSKESIMDNSLGRADDVTKAFNEDFDISFISDSINVSGAERTSIGSRISQTLLGFLNQGVFEGTLELPGDPFYLFDAYLQPYSFIIKITLLRPNYLEKQQNSYEYKTGGTSYLSGYYVVSKINHAINEGGFITTLNLLRWPEV